MLNPSLTLYLIKMKFKFLQNISHYYNDRFAFPMPVFIISILSFNKFNIAIHSNIRFMVIAYNQHLHSRIQYEKNLETIIIHFIII
jgi:hypothetical protein